MINEKCNCEREVSSQNLAFRKTTSSEKVALAKKYDCFEKVRSLKSSGSENVAYSKRSFIKK